MPQLRFGAYGRLSAALAAALALTFAAAAPAPPAGESATKMPTPATAPVQDHPGEALYQRYCAACHDHPEATRAPARATLAEMSYHVIQYALTQGKMQAQGAALGDDARAQLINYLTGRVSDKADEWTSAMKCPQNRKPIDFAAGAAVATFGFDLANTRALTARQTGITKAQLSNLELAWAIAFPSATMMRAQPAVVGSTLFLPVAESSALYAIDISAAQPCLRWVYHAAAPLRTSAAFGMLAGGRPVLAFSGLDTTVYLLDARTGAALWTRKVGRFQYSLTTGTPVVLKDRIIVPVAQYEIVVAGYNAQQCCTNHGYVLSLEPDTGKTQWTYDTMEDATPQRDRGDGKMLWGPSGAPIWNSPAVDERRGLMFVGTGEANSAPTHKNTDALIAIRLKDGKQQWSMQGTDRDIFLSACGPNPPPSRLNCEKDTVYRDVDFGASAILAKRRTGADVLLGGQKSGTVWALDPATGKLVWRRDLGVGTPLGGVHWGIAYDGETVFAPISNVGRASPSQTLQSWLKPGMYAIDVESGAIKWNYAASPDCSGDRPKRMPQCQSNIGFSGAPTVIDGAVVEGSLDGYLHILDAKDGKEMFKFDTAQTFKGVNGVEGRGGAIDAASIIAANGMVFVGSGYGMFGQAPGNVLLAFRPKAK